MLEAKGYFKKLKFELINESKKLILVMEPKMRAPGFDYKIETSNNTLSEDQLIELLIYCGFGTNLYLKTMYASLGFAAGI